MNEGRAGLARCGTVWLTATSAVLGLAAWVLPDLEDARRVLAGPGLADQPFDRLLVWLCAAAALAGGCWLWTLTTVVAIEAARGRTNPTLPGVPTALRRLVLAACGVALAGGVVSPAVATPGQLHQDHPGAPTQAIVQGLPLPERATGAIPGGGRVTHSLSLTQRWHVSGRVVVVRPGDTLWDLAERDLPETAGSAAIAHRWHLIYDLNRNVIGDDPDLIHPEQRLRLPRN